MDTGEYIALVEGSTNLLPRLGSQAEKLLRNAETVAEHLSPIVDQFMTSLSVEKIPDLMKEAVSEGCRILVYYGLFTHCLLFDSPNRMKYSRIDLDALFKEWIAKSLTANSTLNSYDKDNEGYPSAIFDAFYKNRFEPMQRELKIGWWKRLKNKNRFKNFFASGVLLGMLYDMETKKVG